MPRVKDHIHKYMRVINDRNKDYIVYKCMFPGCPHWLRKELLLGRESICWICNTSMFLNAADLSMKKPRHYNCRKIKEELAS